MHQHRAYLALSFRENMEALEGLCDLSLRLLENCRRQGRPYRDPYTGEIVLPPAQPEALPLTVASPAGKEG